MEQSWEVLQCLEYQQGVKIQFYSNEITSLMFFRAGKQKTSSLPPIQITASLLLQPSRIWEIGQAIPEQ